ncbi:unnamed protein product [Schistosoma rodhaini]|uniref:Glycoprotein n=1 Tax=Schistosoma mansoni TaxID=6183 RepID=A0A5K4FFD1_SCHMA|nr:unnamed protein product [Schistosoma rodhaini]
MNASIKRERLKPSSSISIRNNHNNNFTKRLKNRICSNSCLKIIYLSCATLISASFIIECILLHLIIIPYLSESIFEEGMCKYSSSRRDDSNKRCENKCSKERSTFPCLQLKVIFTPIHIIPYKKSNEKLIKNYINYENYHSNNNNNDHSIDHSFVSMIDYSTVTSDATIISTDTSNYTIFYDFESSESRIVYLYDYFSTFTAYKTSRCATSPCHRREEDNKLAVEEFKRDLSRRNIFRCYATPTPSHTTLTSNPHFSNNIFTNDQQSSTTTISSSSSSSSSSVSSISQSSTILNNSTLISMDNKSPTNRYHLPLTQQLDSNHAAAILHRLYTSSMFIHGLLWPGGIFLTALIILLFTYFTDSCEAWAGDKTVIA